MIISDATSGNRISVSNTAGTEQSLPVVGRNGSQLTLSSLHAGDSIQAKVVSRDGDSVRLQVDGNKYIDAKLSSGINVEPGKDVVFQVRSTSSGITLSPLFTNTSSDPNISKALSMAGLPLTSDTVTMTKSMMQAGMSIDRASLVGMFRDISAYANSSVIDIVDLHRLGIEVNENNLEQLNSYKNLSHQLGEGMNDVAGKLTELVDNLIKDSNSGINAGDQANALVSAAKVFEGALSIAAEYDWEAVGDNNELPDASATAANGIQGAEEGIKEASDAIKDSAAGVVINELGVGEKTQAADNSNLSPMERALLLLGAKTEETTALEKEPGIAENAVNDRINLSSESIESLRNEILSLADELKGAQGNTELRELNITGKDASTALLIDFLKNSIDKAISEGDTKSLARIMNNSMIRDNVLEAMKAQWNITPEQVADKNNVKELYQRLQRQLNVINESLDSAGLKNTPAGESAGNMGNNLDFLNQVNQMYAYVQLPLKLSGGDSAHGDLYVYSNGKKMSNNDGKVSALLHLDMEHLGPLDVYVAMDTGGLDKKVTTQFTVADDETLDLLNVHMDELTKRLEAKGYSCKARMSIKGEETSGDDGASSNSGIGPVIDMTGSMRLAEYSFDVRT